MTSAPQGSVVRSAELRPRWRQVLTRGAAVVVVNAFALAVMAWLLSGLSIDGVGAALLAGLVVGLVGAVVWPALAFLVVPLSVLTLGIGAILLEGLMVFVVLDELPGVELNGFGTAVVVAVGLGVVGAAVASVLSIEDDAWFDEMAARRARRVARRSRHANPWGDTAGLLVVQIDGLAEPVLRRALSSGDVPTLHRWIEAGSHRIVSWDPEWSCQTGVSQCGILHGSVEDMPAFRWVERSTGRTIVSNRPASAAEIEQRHSDGEGLLAHGGSSYGNLFTGDADRAVLTMSVAGKKKEGRVGAGYGRYFMRPNNAARTLIGTVVEIARERRATADQRQRDVRPRIARGWVYAFLRAFTTIVSRDVSVEGVLNDIAEGRPIIYVDLLGYDEVAHHSGPQRADALAVLRDLDRQIARFERALRWAPRPYHLVVLSDHGQTQGEPFHERFGETLADVVARLCGGATTGDPDAEAGRTESSAWLRQARHADDTGPPSPAAQGTATVLASGNLGLIYLPGATERLTMEEIEARHPGLVRGLHTHPGIGFVLVRSSVEGSLVLGPEGSRSVATGAVTGTDPLAPFGPRAAVKVATVDAYPNVADLMVNSVFEPDDAEVNAFEHQVSSHGGLGGDQQLPFLLHPVALPAPDEPILGPVGVHRVLKGWRVALEHPEVRLVVEGANEPA